MSITWTDRPHRDGENGNWRLLRVPRSGAVRGIILSRNLVGTGLHYFRGRSTPCIGSRCEACEEGMMPRWYGYVAIWNPSGDRLAIVEITDGAADEFDRHRARHNNLRGARLTLRRQGNRPNGRILSELEPGSIDDERLPPEPDVVKCLEKIWGIDADKAVHVKGSAKGQSNRVNPKPEPSRNGSH